MKNNFLMSLLVAGTLYGEVGTPAAVSQINNDSARTTYYNSKIVDYAKAIYNSRDATKIISLDGASIVEFFRLSDEFKLSTEDTYASMRLLTNKIRSCEIFDDAALNDILEVIPGRLLRHMTVTPSLPRYSMETLQQDMERLMLSHFTNHFDLFQSAPDKFVADLSKTLSHHTAAKNSWTDMAPEIEWRERLRNTTVRFVETMLSKTVWDQNAHEGIWNSVMRSANSIYQLATYKIVGHMDELDLIYGALNDRFCWYLDFTGGKFPVSFYEEIEDDISRGAAFYLELGEQDEGIRTKKELLTESVLRAKTKAIAASKGFLLDVAQKKEPIYQASVTATPARQSVAKKTAPTTATA